MDDVAISFNSAEQPFFDSLYNGINSVISSLEALSGTNYINPAAIEKLKQDRDYIRQNWPALGLDLRVVRSSVMEPIQNIIAATKKGKGSGVRDTDPIDTQWSTLVTALGSFIKSPPLQNQKYVISPAASLAPPTQFEKIGRVLSNAGRKNKNKDVSIADGVAATIALGDLPNRAIGNTDSQMSKAEEAARGVVKPPRKNTLQKAAPRRTSGGGEAASPQSPTDGRIRGLFGSNKKARTNTGSSAGSASTSSTAPPKTYTYPAAAVELPPQFIAELEDTSVHVPSPGGLYEADSPTSVRTPQEHGGIQPTLWPSVNAPRRQHDVASPVSPTSPTSVKGKKAADGGDGPPKEKPSRSSTGGSATTTSSTTSSKDSGDSKKERRRRDGATRKKRKAKKSED